MTGLMVLQYKLIYNNTFHKRANIMKRALYVYLGHLHILQALATV